VQRRRRPALEREGNAEQRERMIHLVTHPDLEDGEKIGRQALAQPMRAEGTEGDGEKPGSGGDHQER